VHLCPVVAAVTAQNSMGVTQVAPVSAELLDAQLAALAADIPPAVIKTGLLGSVENVQLVARWVDKLRACGPVALVVDPVFGATTGASFAGDEVLRAYRELLLPRASLLTPNESEALRLLGADAGACAPSVPDLARQLRAAGPAAIAITGGDSTAVAGHSLDWVDTPHASGWLRLPRVDTPHTHGTGCTFASSAAAAMALDFVEADALVLAKMAVTHALRHGRAVGQGAGPAIAREGFATQADLMPFMSWDEYLDFGDSAATEAVGELGLYAIVETADRVAQVVNAGVKTVQLRMKTPAEPDEPWHAALRDAIARSIAACQAAGALLIVNDHWRMAHELGARAVHLGQEDLLALGPEGRSELARTGLQLGISSHSLWELARARALSPAYAACGPVWPTLTKAMPWRPQGLDNLAWWVHMAGMPVVAIGGILEPAQLKQAAQSGASGICVVRGIGSEPKQTIPAWQAALDQGRQAPPLAVPMFPHPSLVFAVPESRP